MNRPLKGMGKNNSKYSLLYLTIVFIGAVVTFGLVMPAYGDGLTMKSVLPSYTVVEPEGVLLQFIVTNHTNNTLDIMDFGIGDAGPASGDISDALFGTGEVPPPYFLHFAPGCQATLAPGASCDIGFVFVPGPGPLPLETGRSDSGTQEITAFVSTAFVGGLTAFGHTHVTVTDSAVPEPPSLLLLGASVLVLGIVTVWRSRQKTDSEVLPKRTS